MFFKTLISSVYIASSKQKCSIPASDPLHLFKIFIGKIIDYKIQFFPDSNLFNCNEIKNAFNIEMALGDKSPIS